MIEKARFEIVVRVIQQFIKLDNESGIIMIIAKIADEFLVEQNLSFMNWLTVAIKYDSR